MADYRRNRRFTELLNTVSGDYARSEIVDILDDCLRNVVPNNNYTIYINNNAPETSSSNRSSGGQNIGSAIDGLVHTIVNEISDPQGSGPLRSGPLRSGPQGSGPQGSGPLRSGLQNTYEVVISDTVGPGEHLHELMSNMFSSTGSFTGSSLSPHTSLSTGSSTGSFTGSFTESLPESLTSQNNQPSV